MKNCRPGCPSRENFSGKYCPSMPLRLTGRLSSNPGCQHTTYEGPYEVTPKAFEEQVLETHDQLMEDDVRVKQIPYFEFENSSGGLTAYIAKGVEIQWKDQVRPITK